MPPRTREQYQSDAEQMIANAINAEGMRRVLCVMPTGTGKTVVGERLARRAARRARRVLWLASGRDADFRVVTSTDSRAALPCHGWYRRDHGSSAL